MGKALNRLPRMTACRMNWLPVLTSHAPVQSGLRRAWACAGLSTATSHRMTSGRKARGVAPNTWVLTKTGGEIYGPSVIPILLIWPRVNVLTISAAQNPLLCVSGVFAKAGMAGYGLAPAVAVFFVLKIIVLNPSYSTKTACPMTCALFVRITRAIFGWALPAV